jgi:predicted phosphohydrolase
MILQYCSDLHLEFSQNEAYIKANPIKPIGDILILAGDITLFTRIDRQKDFFDYISDHFEATYWIPGNHEYYQSDISNRSGSFEEKIKSNVSLINNVVKKIGAHQLLFSTLWSSISLLNGWRIERGLNDFYQISYNGKRMQVPDYNGFHKDCVEFLRPALEIETTEKKVVITHHVPTFKNYPPEYKGDFLNEAFATVLDDLILDTTPDYWIYGHHHQNIQEFKIGHTKMLTNQLGYVQQDEHLLFHTDKCIEL